MEVKVTKSPKGRGKQKQLTEDLIANDKYLYSNEYYGRPD